MDYYKKSGKTIITIIIFAFLLGSCGFPGPVITYNKTADSHEDSTTKTIETRLCYFCFDYDGNFQCQKYKEITVDTLTNIVIFKSTIRGTELQMKDGRQKRITVDKQFDNKGQLIKKTRWHHQTYGRAGRLKYFREVEYLANGQKKITIKKGTKLNPNRLEIVRYKGEKIKY